MRQFEHAYTCPGCGVVMELKTEVEERELARQFNPAVYIAHEKASLERFAATEHAKRGCRRPV